MSPSGVVLKPRGERPIRPSLLPRRLCTAPRRAYNCRRRQWIRASGDESSSGSQSWKWNPFKRDTSKQAAAEKALRDAMGDRKDVLAQFDASDGGDGGGGGPVDGGWNWSWNWDDWKDNFGEMGRLFLRWFAGIGQTVKAILVCALIIFAASMIGPTLSAISTFVRVLLRLESAEDAYGTVDKEPAGMHRSVLFSDDEDEEETLPSKLSEAALRRKERRERQRMHKEETTSTASKK